MDDETLTELQDSIEHWRRLETGERLEGETTGSADCALCALFQEQPGGSSYCVGCPVSHKTQRSLCKGTPYVEACVLEIKHGLDSPEFKAAAKKMRKFLESLLPKSIVTKVLMWRTRS